jgi:DNA-binding CsgD family transcriptional regulator
VDIVDEQFKSFIQMLLNPLSKDDLEALLDQLVKGNGLEHWQLLQRQVLGAGHEQFDICLGQNSKNLDADEFENLQITLTDIAHDPAEIDPSRAMINYWEVNEEESGFSRIDEKKSKDGQFIYATLSSPFINGTEYILTFRGDNIQITDSLDEKMVSAFLITWRSIGSIPDIRNDKQIKLGKRERQVLSWTSQGKTSFEISKILNLSEHTINNYVTNAANKLGTNNRVHTVCRAIMLGLI